jgi:hypothetical protein
VNKLPKIVVRKLGKEKSWGLAHSDNLIELDSSLRGYRYLLYLIHEYMHIRHPEWSETKVRKESSLFARTLWQQKFRRIED